MRLNIYIYIYNLSYLSYMFRCILHHAQGESLLLAQNYLRVLMLLRRLKSTRCNVREFYKVIYNY